MPIASIHPGEQKKSSEWKNETGEKSGLVIDFIKKLGSLPQESRPRYDGFNEFHFSGTNGLVAPKIWNGTATVIEVSVFYEADRPTQVHVIFDGENGGHNIDVYFQGKALEDLLASDRSEWGLEVDFDIWYMNHFFPFLNNGSNVPHDAEQWNLRLV